MRRASVLAVAALCLLGAGCGDGMLRTRGRVLQGGQPLVAKDGETPVLTDTADIQSYLISSRIKPEELLLCPEGDTVYKSADQFGFTIPF